MGDAEASTAPFTEMQADRGLQVYRGTCSECHTRSEFRGEEFQADWRDRSVWVFYRNILRTMPEDNPGGLDPQQYVDVVAFILGLNGFPAGDVELVAEEGELRAYSMAAPEH